MEVIKSDIDCSELFTEAPAQDAKAAKVQREPREPREPRKTRAKSPEDIEKHQKLIITLQRYSSSPRFGEYLSGMGFKLNIDSMKSKSVEDLEELLERVRMSINNKNSNKVIAGMVKFATTGIERVACTTPIGRYVKLKGFSKLLEDNEDFQDNIEQLQLEYNDITNISPEKRLLMLMATTALQTHAINKAVESMQSLALQKLQAATPAPAELPAEVELQPIAVAPAPAQPAPAAPASGINSSPLVFDEVPAAAAAAAKPAKASRSRKRTDNIA